MENYHTEVPLSIDIDRLGKCYLDFRSKLGFRTDDKTLRDFNAICINRIPGDEKSITGGNVRGLYWTKPDTTNVEEQRLPYIEEHRYTEICPEFKDTYVEEVYNLITSKFKIGRVRFLMKPPRSCLSWHRDPEMRLHIPIITNEGCRMIINDVSFHMPSNGSAYIVNNKEYHNFFNGSEIDRVHLVATILEKGNE
tara:strand:+ start:101 stop:685 length:585 start_codon:yes stop_codon:yes gene_type:complete